MASRLLGFCLLSAVLAASPAVAQVRELSGQVTNQETGAAVAEAQVSVVGTEISIRTGQDGRFTFNIPGGDQALTVRAIGYKRQTVTAPAGATQVGVPLEPDPFKLEEVVVTGQSTGIERQNLPNAVATVSADELTRAPTQTVESALQGKIPGALIQENSGAPGGGIQVNLRGVSTINASAEPLWVIDGIVISNAQIPNGQNAVSCAQCAGNPRNQDNPTNRMADLNPEDIERIEVLKGGSAASIYGAKATNGVIIVTTKRGQQGKPQFNISQRLGTFWRANTLGSRTFETLADAQAAFNPDSTVARLFAAANGRTFDNEAALYGEHPLSYETDMSVSGGTEQTRYFVSGLIKNDGGIGINTGYKKQGVRINLDQQLGDWIQLSANSNVLHSISKRGLSNNDNSGTSPYLVFPFTPNFVDLRPQSGIPEDELIAADFPLNPFERSNPLQTFTFLKNNEDTWRALGTLTARATVVSVANHTWQLIAIGGADYFEQDNDFVSPRELQFEPNDGQAGTAVLSKSSNRNLNLAVNSNWTYTPSSGKYQSTFSAGVQYEDRVFNATQILARDLPSGQENPDQATSATPFQDEQTVRDLGLYGQEELLLMDRRLLLTAGLRADRTSNNGDTGKYFFYPKGAVSYRFLKPLGGLDEIKLRAAFGQTGNQPLYGQKFASDSSGTIGGLYGVFPASNAGDVLLEPERQTEFEGGFDALFANGRAELNFTVYQRMITNLILQTTLAPSGGQEFRTFNSDGRLRNRGVEASLNVSPVQTQNISWLLRTTFFLNRSQVRSLGGLPAFETGGFGTSLGAFFIEPGASATQIVGREGIVGDANPDFQMSFSSDLTYSRLSLGFLWDWKQGGDVLNLTEFLYDAAQNSKDFETAGRQRSVDFATKTAVYVQDASYLKLREVTLAYNLPETITRGLFGGTARYVRLTASARNLLRFTGYRGLDPEVSNFSNQAIVRNIDVAPFPPSKSFFFGFDLGF
jgi:TonB-dependent starch-binding outer membrane protein SusC